MKTPSTCFFVADSPKIFGESATKKQVDGVFIREKRWFKCENIEGSNKLVHRKLLNEGKSFAQSLGKDLKLEK